MAHPAADAVGPYRETDPDSSKRAAYAVAPRSGTQRRKILTAVVSHPRTRKQLERDLRQLNSSVDARVWELVRGGWLLDVERPGEDNLLIPSPKTEFWVQQGLL